MSFIRDFADLALADPGVPATAAESGHPAFLSASLAAIALDPAPIEPSWIIGGAPQARAKLHSTSADGFSSTTIWACSAGAFRWNFVWDETVHILEGSVKVTDETGRVTVITEGDIAYFAAGSWAKWEIDSHVKKIAFCRRAFPAPVLKALGLKTWLSAMLRGAKPASAPTGFAAPEQA